MSDKKKVFTSSCLYGWQDTRHGNKEKIYQRILMQFDNNQQKYIDNIQQLSKILGINFNDLISSQLEVTVKIIRLKGRNYYNDGTSELKKDKSEYGFKCKGLQKDDELCEYCGKYLDGKL